MQKYRDEPAAALKACIESTVLAYCGQAGLFAPAGQPFAPCTEGPTAVFWGGGLSPAGRRVVAAVSGGADSMALLRILLALREKLEITVAACHVNHGLRGGAADRDEAFVRAECARLGVPLLALNARDLGAVPPPNAGEDWARRLRYSCFEGLGQNGDTLVATAHTLTDQAETLLFRLARGTGVHGAAGIPPKRGIYVRPLLCLTRAQTEEYCAAAGQGFVNDETNQSDAYARNRLRHYALPALRQANAGAEQNMGRFCRRMARADAYFAAAGRRLLEEAAAPRACWSAGPWALAPLQAADPLILEAALHQLVAPVRDPEEKYIALLAGILREGGGAVQLTDSVRFAVSRGCLRKEEPAPRPSGPSRHRHGPAEEDEPPGGEHARRAAETGGQPPCKEGAAAAWIPLSPGEYAFPGGYLLKIELLDRNILEFTPVVHKKDLKNMADYAKISTLSVLRTRMPGDIFYPAGRGVGKRLKKLMNEQKIPLSQRQYLPLLAAGNQVLWLWDQGFAEGLAPGKAADTVLRITQKKIGEDTQA